MIRAAIAGFIFGAAFMASARFVAEFIQWAGRMM